MPLHLGLSGDFDAVNLLSAIRAAEAGGAGGIWLTDSRFFEDCFVVLGAAAVQTERITLATGVNDPYSRHPAQLASNFASLSQFAPDRLILGLGAGGSGLKEMGRPRTRPVATVELAIDVIRRLFAGEMVDAKCQAFSCNSAVLSAPVKGDIPIAVIAHGPRMYELAARQADVVFVANYVDRMGMEWGLTNLATALEQRSAHSGKPRTMWRVDIYLDEDEIAARDVARLRIAQLLQRGYYTGRQFLDKVGLEHLTERPGNIAEDELDALVDAIAIVGTPDRVRDLLAERLDLIPIEDVCARVFPAKQSRLVPAVKNLVQVARSLEHRKDGM